MKRKNYTVEYLHRPGQSLDEDQLSELVQELRTVASDCFDAMPDYQCISGRRETLARNAIAIARRPDGTVAGFCSALLLDIAGVGEVLHLGLTCVAVADRGARLTHVLAEKVLVEYLLRRPFDRVWFSNVACVLSSLGNVALHFDEVHPSPFTKNPPTPKHREIARAIDLNHRGDIYIDRAAVLDPDTFVFRGSNQPGNMFHKAEEDDRFHHREAILNDFYASKMRWEHGDEIVQVGHISLRRVLKHGLRQAVMARKERRRLRKFKRRSLANAA
jgi:hypothetical protein